MLGFENIERLRMQQNNGKERYSPVPDRGHLKRGRTSKRRKEEDKMWVGGES